MTDYVPYTPDEYAPDAPGTALHFQRWFENWIAGFEGAAGAPRLVLAALERLVPGDFIRMRADALHSVSGSTFVTVPSFTLPFIQAGTVRIAFEHRVNVNNTSEVRIFRRRAGTSTLLTTISQGGNTFVAKTYNLDVQPGDQVFLQHRNTSSSLSEIQNVRLQLSAASFYWPVGNFGEVEGNPVL
jgi:hypothetical protein